MTLIYTRDLVRSRMINWPTWGKATLKVILFQSYRRNKRSHTQAQNRPTASRGRRVE